MIENNKNELAVMQFENTDVDIITENGELLFEVYSTGMALGQFTMAKGKCYPHKARIDANLKNANIKAVVRNAKLYITESQLYDFMLEMKTDKCKRFRKWVTNEVLPSIRKTGGYIVKGQEYNVIAETLKRLDERDIENQKAILALQKQVLFLNKQLCIEPDMRKINTWKKHTGTPAVERLAAVLGKDSVDKSLYGDIYEAMGEYCGFNRVTAVMDYRAKYHLGDDVDVPPINAVADDPVYQRDFILTVNKMISRHKSAEYSVEQSIPVPITPTDRFNAVISPLVELCHDKSARSAKTLALVYSKMHTKRSWAVSLGKNKCNTKKDLIMKKDSEYDLFCKTVNEMIKELE